MKTITISGTEYKIEFTVEASLYSDCTEKMFSLMSNLEDKEDVKTMITSVANIPQTALTLFYAGLMEHHGEDGDNTVKSIRDAKRLIKTYFAEGEEDESRNFYGLMAEMIDCMTEDGFFKRIGLDRATENQTETETATSKTNLTKK